jgi:hypothetical protein
VSVENSGYIFGYRKRWKQKSSYQINDNCLIVFQFLVRLARFERATAWFVDIVIIFKLLKYNEKTCDVRCRLSQRITTSQN